MNEDAMFGSKTQEKQEIKVEKLSGPKRISGPVGKKLTTEYKWSPDLLVIISMVVRKNSKGPKAFDVRIFDCSEAESTGVQVKNFTSLDEHPELILYEGWYDEVSKQAELTEKKKINLDTPLFTEEQILQKIEALTEPARTVFFYQARGPAVGGPLGRGAAVVELNPKFEEKKQKKYNVYTVNVVNMEPVADKRYLFNSDKAEEVTEWVKGAHHKRIY